MVHRDHAETGQRELGRRRQWKPQSVLDTKIAEQAAKQAKKKSPSADE